MVLGGINGVLRGSWGVLAGYPLFGDPRVGESWQARGIAGDCTRTYPEAPK